MLGRLFHGPTRFLRDQRGGVSVMLVLMLIPMIAVLGMAMEGSSWFLGKRALQNAADSAAVAASLNDCRSTTATCYTAAKSQTYDFEAKAVTARFGFTNAEDNVTVVATDAATCPNGDTNCYGVTITKLVPIGLVGIVGFRGDALIDGQPAQTIRSYAVARPRGPPDTYCISTKSTDAASINFKGGGATGSLDFGGCNFKSNGGASCTNKVGGDSKIGFSDVNNANDGKDCGSERVVTTPVVDNFDALKSSIPNPNTNCSGGFPKAATGGKTAGTVVAANRLTGAMTFSTSAPICGDAQLTGDTTVGSDSVLLINNGRLDLQGFKLSTTGTAHLTIIFSGVAGSSAIIVGTGTLDYSAPTSGTWSGVAMYVNPTLTAGSNINFTYSGNSPAFDITGLIYAPKSNVTLSGSINHATAGLACLGFMVNTIGSNGTMAIFAKPTIDCPRAGLTLPGVPGTETRQALVQ